MSKHGTDRDRYFHSATEDLMALGAELVDLGERLLGLAAHQHGVALAAIPPTDLSVREARTLGQQTLEQRRVAARRRRAAAAA